MTLDTGTWAVVVKKKYLTSSSFKALDAAVKAYLLDKTKLPQLKAAWSAWVKKFTGSGGSYKDSDRYAPGGALDDVNALVAGAQQVGGIGSLASHAIAMGGGGLRHVNPVAVTAPQAVHTGDTVAALGWTYVAYDSSNPNHSWAGPAGGGGAPPNYSQTARINESFRRAKMAVELARDAMTAMPPVGSKWTNTEDQVSYINYFGPFDVVRFSHVLENYRILALAFGGHPNVVDIRGTTSGGNCYAACVRKNLKADSDRGLALTGKVDIFLGGAFFNGAGKYGKSTDATVGTLIHEFAHGALNAVDAPNVNPGGTGWTQVPNLTVGHADYGISPDPWNNQASTEDDDKRLAKFAPDVAVRSADNYGQFARELLMRKGR